MYNGVLKEKKKWCHTAAKLNSCDVYIARAKNFTVLGKIHQGYSFLGGIANFGDELISRESYNFRISSL